VDDGALPALDHAGNERSVEPNGTHQVQVELLRPMMILKRGKPAAGR
jgi:hypothetical protein